MSKAENLLNTDIKTLIKNIAIPSSTAMFLNTMYNIIDTFYAGMISTYAVAALSYSFMIFFMIMALSFGFTFAISSLVGNSIGANKKLLSKLYASNGMIFLFLISLVIMFFAYMFLDLILQIMGAKLTIKDLTKEYLYIIFAGTTALLISLGGNSILISTGDTKSFRNISLIGLVLNFILNPMFVYGFLFIPKIGLSGIALSTVLIQFVVAFYIIYKVGKTDLISFKDIRYFKPNIKILKNILSQGIPSSVNMITMGIGSLIITSFVSNYGYKAVAGFGIGFRIEQILLLPALGINSAVLSIISNNFGAKKYKRVKETVLESLKYGYKIGLFGLIFLYIFGKYLMMIFDDDKEVIEIGYSYILIEALIFFGYITLFVTISTLQAIKKPKIIPYISTYRQIFMRLILFYLVVEYFMLPLESIWWSTFFLTYSAAIFSLWYVNREIKLLKQGSLFSSFTIDKTKQIIKSKLSIFTKENL
jgi:putative MATE family efflux protein